MITWNIDTDNYETSDLYELYLVVENMDNSIAKELFNVLMQRPDFVLPTCNN